MTPATPNSPTGKTRRTARWAALAAACALAGCSVQSAHHQSFDSATFLRQQYAQQVGSEQAESIVVPFQLQGEVLATIDEKVRPAGDERTRVSRILDYVFTGLDLDYSLAPTKDANETFNSRSGNCLSFVNLFVGIGRHIRLSPFYVEVEDYQRWDHRRGMVVSQGHIVAGMFVDGQLQTFDFLPYQVKSYRKFKPIDDLTAAAHYYNNLGAEALLDGDLETAYRHLSVAARVDPAFVKAANNLGVWHARNGDFEEAEAIYAKALAVEPENVPILTNLARVYQQTGRLAEADELLAQVDGVRHQNPFFFVYRGEVALAQNDPARALEYMRDALSIDTETPEVHLGLTKVYVALGEIDKAAHHLRRALELDPSHPGGNRLARMLGPQLGVDAPTGDPPD